MMYATHLSLCYANLAHHLACLTYFLVTQGKKNDSGSGDGEEDDD